MVVAPETRFLEETGFLHVMDAFLLNADAGQSEQGGVEPGGQGLPQQDAEDGGQQRYPDQDTIGARPRG